MKPSFTRLATHALLAALCACTTFAATAQAWPNRPIRLVVPFPPGGGTDIVARALGQKLAVQWAQAVVVDNKPGASTIIGADAVAKAEPDGYTLLVSGSSTYTVNPALRARLPYNPVADLVPVAIIARAPLVLVVPASSPYTTLAELIAAARARPRSINYSTFGAGSAPHLAGELFGLAAGVQLQDIPYKGSSQASMALIGGEIQMSIDTVASAAPHVRAGKLRALAIVGHVRSSVLPGVATVAELKLPDATFDAWYALAAPARTPAPVLQKIGRDLLATMGSADMKEQLRAQAMEPAAIGTAEARNLIEGEIARYRALAHRANIKAE